MPDSAPNHLSQVDDFDILTFEHYLDILIGDWDVLFQLPHNSNHGSRGRSPSRSPFDHHVFPPRPREDVRPPGRRLTTTLFHHGRARTFAFPVAVCHQESRFPWKRGEPPTSGEQQPNEIRAKCERTGEQTSDRLRTIARAAVARAAVALAAPERPDAAAPTADAGTAGGLFPRRLSLLLAEASRQGVP